MEIKHKMAQHLFPIPYYMSYKDCNLMEGYRKTFIQGWEARDKEVKELIKALQILFDYPDEDLKGWANGDQSVTCTFLPSHLKIVHDILTKYNKTT